MEKVTIYGNEIPPNKVKASNAMFSYYAKKNNYNTEDYPLLTTIPYKNGYDDFGIMSIVAQSSGVEVNPIQKNKGILLGTMRMGFGHCRMSLALASAAKHLGYTPYWFDMLSFENTAASKTIHQLEYWYNLGSRISQSSKFFNDKIWENVTSEAGRFLSASYRNKVISQIFAPLYHEIPKDMPCLSTHPWVGYASKIAGIKNIITIIPDNYPLGFHVVEGTMHSVQTPSKYMGYRTFLHMGKKYPITNCMPQEDIFESGHYIDHEIRHNIENDCAMRIKRMKDKKPRRFLLTMGGAGAQVQKFADIIEITKHDIEDHKVSFFVNMGDHKGRWADLSKKLTTIGIDFQMHDDWKTTKEFINAAEKDTITGVHIFLHDDFYAAVYATNLLMRVSDVMITKPSELSFYPVPKLFIQRVGRHEAWGAICASEGGDGTIETTTASGLKRTLNALIHEQDLLDLYCKYIIKNAKFGKYDGAYNVVKKAAENG